MPVYQYQGLSYDLPEGLSNDQAIAKIKTHLGQSVTGPSASIPGAEQYDAAQAAEQTRKANRTPGEITSEAATKQGKSVWGGLEAAYGLGHNVSAYLTAFPYSAASIAAKKLLPSQWADELLGNVEKMSYLPKTDEGQKYLQNIGEALQPFGLSPYANIGQVGARGSVVSGRRVPKAPKEVPVSPTTKSLDTIDAQTALDKKVVQADVALDSGAAAFDKITESQVSGWNEPIRPTGSGNAMDTVVQQLETMRQEGAQKALEGRQEALEAEVKRQTTLDMNAAQRARQERAGTGYSEWSVNKAAEEARATNEWLGARKQDSIVEDFGNNDPMARMSEMRVDENGIPIRADLSMEAQNLQNPLQRNLWGDELPMRTGDDGVPLTQALDAMEPGPMRDAAMSQLRGQRGAIDPEVFKAAVAKLRGVVSDDIIRQLESKPDYKSRNRMVLMPVDEFLAHAKTGKNINKQEGVGDWFGKKPMHSEPQLWYNKDPKTGQDIVWGHEGRHRARAFKEAGFEYMPVRVTSDRIRWSEQNNPNAFDYRPDTDYPTKLTTENKQVVDFPIPREEANIPNAGVFRGMGRSQRGGVNVEGITAEVNKIKGSIEKLGRSAVSGLTFKEQHIAQTINDNSFIPKGRKPADIIAQALTESDGPRLFTQLQSGLRQAGEKVNSTVMRDVARHLDSAEKIGDKYFRQNVKPVERVLSNLPKKDLEVLMIDVMEREMFNGKQYTPEQLAQAGLSADTIAAYKSLREQQVNALRVQNEARAALGKKPITDKGAYFASMWNGNYHMPVYDKQGKLVWYVKTETMGEGRAAAEWFKANHAADFDVAKLKPEYRPQNAANYVPKDAYASYEYMLEVFKDTPMAKEIQGLMEQVQADNAFTRGAHDVHFERKYNIRGFAGDRPWLTRRENAVAAAQAQVQYLKDAYHWAPLQEAMLNIKEVLTNPELVASQPNNIEMAKLYTAQTMGVNKNLFKDIERVAAKATGVSPGTLNRFVGSLKTLTYLSQLGMSTGYAIATPLQALVIGPAQHLKLSNQGIKHNVIKSAANSLSDAAAIFGVHQLDRFGTDKRTSLSPLGQKALRYMEDNGIIDVSLFDEYAALGEHKGVNLLKQTVGATIQLPEKLARTMTFMSFVHHLKDSGMPELQVFLRAEELTNTTLTNFKKSSRPLIVEQGGLVGELAYTYKSPMFNYFNTLFEFGQDAKRTGKYGPLASALMMPALLGGLFAMPMLNELDGAVELMKSGVANFMPEYYSKVKDISVKEAAMKNLPAFALSGAVGEATGANMTSRFSTETMDVENPLGNTFPVASQLDALGSAAKVLMSPSESNVATAIYKNLPPVLKGMYETNDPTFKAGKQGDKTLYYTPSKLGDRDVNVARTKEDETFRKFGLTSLDEARTKDARFLGNKETMRRQDVQKALLTKTVDAIITKNFEGSQKFIEEYVKNGGTSSALTSAINTPMMNSKLTPEQRELVRNRSLIMLEGAMRKREMVVQ